MYRIRQRECRSLARSCLLGEEAFEKGKGRKGYACKAVIPTRGFRVGKGWECRNGEGRMEDAHTKTDDRQRDRQRKKKISE